jgi:hypothetical protein
VILNTATGVAIMLGTGSFQSPSSYASALPIGVVVGDFNLDGNLDVAVSDTSDTAGQVIVFVGNGDGTLGSSYAFSAGGSSLWMATGDLNGDGREDIAVANYNRNSVPGGDTVAVLLNTTPLPAIPVSIRIKPPAAAPVAINLGSGGATPVAILSTTSFDARQVDPGTISLSGAQVRRNGNNGSYSCSNQDVNNDGLLDLLCQVYTNEFELLNGSTVAILTGKTLSGTSIRGEEAITIVPK